jgi:hypothetical protein
MESQSGIQSNDPRIYGRIEDEGCSKNVAYVVVHPTNNFMNHYLLGPLRQRGRAILAINTRYLANDTMLLMERAIQDLGAAVRYLRDRDYRKIVLIGNSGGGALAAFYQQQAECLTLKDTPDGRPFSITQEDLPAADAVALLCAHPGRSYTLTDWIDPSVKDEHDLDATDPSLDMYNTANGPPYDADWLQRYRAAQLARNECITDHALARLRTLEESTENAASDEAFIVHRTMADPRFLDVSLDRNDRVPGTVWGDPRTVNYAPNNIARFCTLRSFLSQWSWRCSRAKGPECLRETSVPVLNVDYTADQIVFPSQIHAWSNAAGGRCTDYAIRGINHYPQSSKEAVNRIADVLVDWGG